MSNVVELKEHATPTEAMMYWHERAMQAEQERDAAVAHIAALERRSIPIADIEAEIDHIEQNGKAVARWSGSENEGRCRELCAMYLREFIVSHRMKLKLEEVRALTPAKDGGHE